MIRVDASPILFFFLFFYSIRVGPSRSELIRPGLAVRVDPVRLLHLPSGNRITEAETGTETEHGIRERRFQEVDLEKYIY